jgi:hypothetical protein
MPDLVPLVAMALAVVQEPDALLTIQGALARRRWRMKLRRMVVLGLGTAMAVMVASGLAAVGVTGMAGAAASGSCLKASGNVNSKVTISKCGPEPGSNAKLVIPSPVGFTPGPTTLTWTWSHHGSGEVTVAGAGWANQGQQSCPTGFDEWWLAISPPIDDSTGVINASGPLAFLICVNVSTGAVKGPHGSATAVW